MEKQPITPETLKDQWRENPKLYSILRKLSQEHLFQKFLDNHLTDLWLPIPKHIVQKILEGKEGKSFLDAQESCLEEEGMPTNLKGQHLSFVDSDCMGLKEVGELGTGGYGEVHHVIDPRTGTGYAKKIMPRPRNFKKHSELMESFQRELSGM